MWRNVPDIVRDAALSACLAVLLSLCGGCVGALGDITVRPRVGFVTGEAGDLTRRVLRIDHQFLVPLGSPEAPDAALLAWVIDPPDGRPPRGTVIVLHGMHASSLSMLGKGRSLAPAGYRAVLVDLRGHGRSAELPVTFGVRECEDLSRVVDDLERRRLLAGKLGVEGISFGAAVAIQFAAHDPRVAAVVSVAGFSSMREEVRTTSARSRRSRWNLTKSRYNRRLARHPWISSCAQS